MYTPQGGAVYIVQQECRCRRFRQQRLREGERVQLTRELRFIDNFRFMSSSLDQLTKKLDRNQIVNLCLDLKAHYKFALVYDYACALLQDDRMGHAHYAMIIVVCLYVCSFICLSVLPSVCLSCV